MKSDRWGNDDLKYRALYLIASRHAKSSNK